MTEETIKKNDEIIESDIQKNPEISTEKSNQLMSEKFDKIKNDEIDLQRVLSQKSEFEEILKSTANIKDKTLSYLKKSNHPRKSEYVSIMDDIKNSKFSIKDENDQINFLSAKLVLNKEVLPSSLHKDFEVIENSNNLTPANKESLTKLKSHAEKELELLNKEAESIKLVDKFGNVQKNITPDDFNSIKQAFYHGNISREEFAKKGNEYLNSLNSKRRNFY